MLLRFFGAKTTLGRHKLEKLGDRVDLTKEEADAAGCTKEELEAGRAPFLLPDELYKVVGFTAMEEKTQSAATMAKWTPEFRKKWAQTLELRSQWLLEKAEQPTPVAAVELTSSELEPQAPVKFEQQSEPIAAPPSVRDAQTEPKASH